MSNERSLVLKSGERFAITGEDGKYWLCGERKFRKLSNSVLSVEEVVDPVKKQSRRKKKPESAEQKEGG